MNVHFADKVTPVLEEYGALTRDAMKTYLPKGAPQQHLYDPVADYPTRGGKMMRPSLCIAVARAFGAPIEAALRTAVAIELLHNALLIHDDIEDESEDRRGAPTLHSIYGTPIALNAGDALAMLSLRPLVDNITEIGPWLSLGIIQEMERMARESAEGQALDLGWRADPGRELTRDDYLEMVLKKTCWLATIYPCRVGAMLGLHRRVEADAFIRFGFFVGAAFQIHDDVLNLQAGQSYGKELCGDLWEAKRTLMLIDVPAHLSPVERVRFDGFMGLGRSERKAADVEWLRDRIVQSGSLERAAMLSRALAGAALHEFTHSFGHLPESRDKAFIRALSTWVFERDS